MASTAVAQEVQQMQGTLSRKIVHFLLYVVAFETHMHPP